MSYSFAVRAASKIEASEKVTAELDKVVEFQPNHADDKQAAQNVAEAYIALLGDLAENQSVQVNMHGSLSWTNGAKYTAASVGVTAQLVNTDD